MSQGSHTSMMLLSQQLLPKECRMHRVTEPPSEQQAQAKMAFQQHQHGGPPLGLLKKEPSSRHGPEFWKMALISWATPQSFTRRVPTPGPSSNLQPLLLQKESDAGAAAQWVRQALMQLNYRQLHRQMARVTQ